MTSPVEMAIGGALGGAAGYLLGRLRSSDPTTYTLVGAGLGMGAASFMRAADILPGGGGSEAVVTTPTIRVAFAKGYNSPPKYPADATGAFLPEAREWCRLHGGRLFEIPKLEAPARRAFVEESLATLPMRRCDGLAIFGHGIPEQLVATGHDNLHLQQLAVALERVLTPDAIVVLYACSTAGGEYGWADRLQEALEALGWRGTVYGHTTYGHTTKNPYWVRGSRGADLWVVAPDSPLWGYWRDLLQKDQQFRLSWWRMTEEELSSTIAPWNTGAA